MAVQGPFKVDFNDVFPHGAGLVGGVEPVADYEVMKLKNKGRSKGAPREFVQLRDRDTQLLVWSADVIDFDAEARDRAFKVKIIAAEQPVPPEAAGGLPVRPVVLEGLSVLPYVKDTGATDDKDQSIKKLAYSLKATGLSAPRAGRQSQADQNKAA